MKQPEKRYIDVVEYGENGGELGVVHRVDVTDKTQRSAETMVHVAFNSIHNPRRFFTRFNTPF